MPASSWATPSILPPSLGPLMEQEAVISALGTPVSPFREVTLLSAATRILIAEMQRLGVGRLIAITGMGAGETAGTGASCSIGCSSR
jgi:hypothetical protein